MSRLVDSYTNNAETHALGHALTPIWANIAQALKPQSRLRPRNTANASIYSIYNTKLLCKRRYRMTPIGGMYVSVAGIPRVESNGYIQGIKV